MISLIAAVSDNGAIGKQGALPWRQKADLQHFKAVTKGHAVVMGLNTFNSIGRPLPERENYVLTHNPEFHHDDVHAIDDLEAIDTIDDDVFIIGGGMVYADTIDMADRLYITEIHTEVDEADTFFPEIDQEKWREVSREKHEKDEQNQYDYEFVIYEPR